MARVTELYLRSPSLSNLNTLDSNGRSVVLKRVPVGEFGARLVGNDSIEDSDLMDVSNKTLRMLSFNLTDSHGNIVDLHNHDFSCVLNFIYESIHDD